MSFRGALISIRSKYAASCRVRKVGRCKPTAASGSMDRLVQHFGETKLLSEIDDNDVSKLIAWRRAHRAAPHNMPKGKKPEDYPLISNATVNRSTTEVLKKLFTQAKEAWRVRFEHEPKWKVHFLPEPVERVRELVGDEGERLDAAMRDDYVPFFEFVHLTGLRKEECVDLRWPHVNWDARQIVRLGKGGKRGTAPITGRVREILEACRDHHPEFVFTYVAARTVRASKAGETVARAGHRKGEGEPYVARRNQEKRIKGRRYPMTLSGVDSAWTRIREKAGVEGFRFHDFRHDFATKMLRKTKNLKLVSRALNHADLKTTMRYAHVQDEDIAEAMEDFHESTRPSGAVVGVGERSHPEHASVQKRDTESQNKSRSRRLKAV